MDTTSIKEMGEHLAWSAGILCLVFTPVALAIRPLL